MKNRIDKQMVKELEELEEGPKEKVQLNSIRATLKKVQNGKIPFYEDIYG